MSNPPSTTSNGATTRSELADAISRSLSSVWHHYAGGRPGSITTEVKVDSVKCVRTEAGNSDPDPEVVEAHNESGRSTKSDAYVSAAITAVSKVTRRKVVAYIPKNDAKNDVATETFILEQAQRKN